MATTRRSNRLKRRHEQNIAGNDENAENNGVVVRSGVKGDDDSDDDGDDSDYDDRLERAEKVRKTRAKKRRVERFKRNHPPFDKLLPADVLRHVLLYLDR
jgi:phosphopantothenoylcysteine synthetase/decarboxylase